MTLLAAVLLATMHPGFAVLMMALSLLGGMAVSLRPSTFVEGGGLIDDVDVTVKEANFVLYNYGGTVQNPVPALAMILVDPDGKEHEQYFSAGDAKNFLPSKDGETPAPDDDCNGGFLTPLGEKASINTNTNLSKFLESLVNAGYPEDKLDESVDTMVGMEFHLKRVAVKRQGLVRTGKNAGREQTVITVGKINKLPWETAKAAPKTAAKTTASKPAAAAAAPAASDVEAEAQQLLLEVLMENDGQVPKAKLATLIFTKAKGNPSQKAISQLVFKDEFIKSVEGVTLKNGVVSMA